MTQIGDDLVQRFRTNALERLARIEAAWALVLRNLDDVASRQLQREVHTLKGESRVVGFGDVNMVCHKLEDLLSVARARGYAVDDDFDLAVNMAIRFMVMLVRKKVGSQLTAIDLPGFVRQIEGVLSRHERAPRSRSGSMPPLLRNTTSVRVAPAIRAQLGPAAVDAFLEYSVATGVRRDRLRDSWHALRELIGVQRAVISAEQLDKYRTSTMALARELGKQIDLRFEIAAAEVTVEVLMALDVAALHLLRNAVDHGIEMPEARAAAGKPEVGSIRLRGRSEGGAYVLSAEDDGLGIDWSRVQARAVELGLASETELAHDRLVELMCHPGLSTRGEASEVSGRGVGLDAVRGSVVELGGTLTASSEIGRSTEFTVSIPTPPITAEGYVIRAPGLRFPVVIAPGWRVLDRAHAPMLVDLGVALGMPASNSISCAVWSFSNGALEVGFLCGDKPLMVQARRLVTTPATSVAEVVTVDSIEGLLVRPDRIPGVT